MKTLAIHTATRDQGEFVLGEIHDAVDMDRVKLDEVAMVSIDQSGEVTMHLHHHLFHHHVIEKSLLELLAKELEPGAAMAVVRGEGSQVDAVGARARAISNGDFKTYEVSDAGLSEVTGTNTPIELDDPEGLLVESAVDIPLQTTILVKAPIS